MFIHRCVEGDIYKLGLNWISNENTILKIVLMLPIRFISPDHYEDFASEGRYYGWRMRVVCLRVRLRRWKNFGPKVKRLLWSCSKSLISVGKQQLISTREMRDDAKLAVH